MADTPLRRRVPVRPPGFSAPAPGYGAPPPGAVMGNPLSVPEAELSPYPDESGPEPLWLKLPADLAPYFEVGFCHTDEVCPYVVMRVKDENGDAEVGGPAEAFRDLAQVLLSLYRSVPCVSAEAAAAAEPTRAAG